MSIPITLELASEQTGLSISSIRSLKQKGLLIEGKSWFKPAGIGRVLICPDALAAILRGETASESIEKPRVVSAKKPVRTTDRQSPVFLL